MGIIGACWARGSSPKSASTLAGDDRGIPPFKKNEGWGTRPETIGSGLSDCTLRIGLHTYPSTDDQRTPDRKAPTVRKARKSYSPQEKMAILRRHLLDKVSILHLCTQLQLQPTVFYRWLKQFFDNGAAALRRKVTAGKQPDRLLRDASLDASGKQRDAPRSPASRRNLRSLSVARGKDVSLSSCARQVIRRHRPIYCKSLATLENTLFAFPPTKRIVPMTTTKITASITAYSAMS